MRTAAAIAIGLVAATSLAVAASCSSFGDAAGANASGDADASAAGDADADADGAVPYCRIVAHFADSRWVKEGATVVTDAGVAVLTPSSSAAMGSIAWSEPKRLDAFELAFVLRVTPPPAERPGDGLAIAWFAGAPPRLGSADGGFGACGIPNGYAVALRLFDPSPASRRTS